MAAHRCIVVARYYAIDAQCYMVVVPGLTEVNLSLSSFIISPYKYLNLFLLSSLLSYNLYHRDLLTCRNYNMNFWVLFGTSASLDNDMVHAHVFYKSHTMVLLLAKGLVLMFPCTAQNLKFILMVCFFPTCVAPNTFPFLLTLILVKMKF
jgi:hypothetical protein